MFITPRSLKIRWTVSERSRVYLHTWRWLLADMALVVLSTDGFQIVGIDQVISHLGAPFLWTVHSKQSDEKWTEEILKSPLGLKLELSANKQFPLGQFIIALWRMQRDSISRISVVAAVLHDTGTCWHIPLKIFCKRWAFTKEYPFFFNMCSPYFLSQYFGLDDKMTSRTTWGLPCNNILFELMAEARSRKTCIEKAHFRGEFRTQIGHAWLLTFNKRAN